jgi:hypothetical protein
MMCPELGDADDDGSVGRVVWAGHPWGEQRNR